MAVEEMRYDETDLEKLRYAFPGINDALLILVWDFARYLLSLQAGIDEYQKAKEN